MSGQRFKASYGSLSIHPMQGSDHFFDCIQPGCHSPRAASWCHWAVHGFFSFSVIASWSFQLFVFFFLFSSAKKMPTRLTESRQKKLKNSQKLKGGQFERKNFMSKKTAKASPGGQILPSSKIVTARLQLCHQAPPWRVEVLVLSSIHGFRSTACHFPIVGQIYATRPIFP